jgi:hypothetical protein
MLRMTRAAAVIFTVLALLATALASNSAPKSSINKSCCQRCACCIEKAPDQPQVPLAPCPSRASTDLSAALAPLVIATLLFERETASDSAAPDRDFISVSSAPLFLRNCAILI